MPLHPVIQSALAAAEGLPAYYELPIAQARAQAKMGYPVNPAPVPVGAVRNLNLPGPAGPLAVRLYTPQGPGPHPLVVFFHGSGFVLLDLDSHDDICRRLCAGAGCLVASLEYRLAPEHRFPVALEDCYTALVWIVEHADELDIRPDLVTLGGSSAGANLAAALTLSLERDTPEAPPSLSSSSRSLRSTSHLVSTRIRRMALDTASNWSA